MKKSLYLGLFLGLVSVCAAFFISLVNSFTSPIIEENLIKAEKVNLEKMYPGSDFKALEFKNDSGLVHGLYEASGKGKIFKLSGYGYSSTEIIFLAAFNEEGVLESILPLQHGETNGFGSRCFEEGYSKTLNKAGKDGDFEILSGATKTSTAIINGLKQAREILKGLK